MSMLGALHAAAWWYCLLQICMFSAIPAHPGMALQAIWFEHYLLVWLWHVDL
jgi:hypothetical protein